MPKKSSAAPKKARWTPAEKAARVEAKARSGKKLHRGQGPSSDKPQTGKRSYADRPIRDDRPARDDRARRAGGFDRPAREGGFDPPRRDDGADRTRRVHPPRHVAGNDPWREREDRRERSTSWRDRASDDRGAGGYRGPSDRPAYQGRSERPAYQGRSERPAHQGRDDRGDRRRTFQPREDRGGERHSHPFRDDRGDGGYQGRGDRSHGADRRQPAYGKARFGDEREARHSDAEAERAEADQWTAYKPKATAGAEVTEDNGFAGLGIPARLVERLARDSITEPFPIQLATIPDAMAGRDVLGRAQTGSGKTLAFGLPTIARLAAAGKARPKKPRSLVLVPTRELAMQVSDALEPLVHVMGLRHKLVAGGLSYEPQITALARGLDLLIATPGRLADLLERGALELDDIEVAILDEADHMADMGFLPEVTAILDRMPVGGQRLLFSATLDKGVDALVERYLIDPVTHSTDDAKASVTTMDHHLFLVEPNHKKVLTAELANREGRTIIFVRTKLGADRVALQLRESGVMAAALHGGLTQGARNRVLGAFRTGTLPVLVATDVAARGIHVDDVALVLQVDPPADHKDYLHRSGRTARAGEKGAVVTLALPHQKRTMERLLAEAGVETKGIKASPGAEAVQDAGGREPHGVAILDSQFRAIVEPARGPRAGGRPRGGRFDGPRGNRSGGPSGARSGGPRHGGRAWRD